MGTRKLENNEWMNEHNLVLKTKEQKFANYLFK